MCADLPRPGLTGIADGRPLAPRTRSAHRSSVSDDSRERHDGRDGREGGDRHDGESSGARRPRDTLVVGLLCDPSLPTEIAEHVADALPAVLAERVDRDVTWQVTTLSEPVEAGASDGERLMDSARTRVRGRGWDLAVCLSDAPLVRPSGSRHGYTVIVADVDPGNHVALCSLPALGGLWLRRRTVDVLAALVAELRGGIPATTGPTGVLATPRSRTVASLRRRTPPDDDPDIGTELVLGRTGRLRLLAGLIRVARPWRLALGLSAALAAGVAGSAFGVLYSSLWTLGAAMGAWRTVGALALGVALFTGWLIGGHGLWENRSARPTALLNVATTLTVLAGAVVFTACLYVVNAIATAVLVPPDYLAQSLGRPVGPRDYLHLPLVASVLGLVAGAVGSGLENDAAVRRAAYSHRERERRRAMLR